MDRSEHTPLLAAKAPAPRTPPHSPGPKDDKADATGSVTTAGKGSLCCGRKEPPRPPGDRLPTRVYFRRFWVLFSFSFCSMFQGLQWNSWGPLNQSVAAAYPGWGSNTVAMMSNWCTIIFVVFVAPMCWFMHTKGLRVGVILCAALMAAATTLRIVPFLTSSLTFFTVMCHLCAILVGIAGTLMMAAPPMIAAVWFPPKERTTAVAVVQMMSISGTAVSYLEPLLVREPSSSPSPQDISDIQEDIQHLLYIYASVAMVTFVAVLLYFPASPPVPPSLSSHVQRLNFRDSIKKIVRNRDLLLVTVSYGVSVGAPSAWVGVLNYSLQDLGMDQDGAMWLGLTMVGSSAVTTLVAGRVTDLMYGHIKLCLLLLLLTSLGSLYWFFLLTLGAVPVTTWQVYVTVIGTFSCVSALSPLFFELAVESAYPCSEVMVGGFITTAKNLVSLMFLFVFLVPNIGYHWVTYLLLATGAAAVIPLLFVWENYSRSRIDQESLESPYQLI